MFIVVDLLTILALWLAVVLVVPHLSGWRKLASVYRAQGPPSGERFPFEFGKIGDVYFWYCVTLYRSADGLSLSLSPFFLFRQSRLLIPWSDLRNPREKQLFLTPMKEFDIGCPSLGRIQVRSEIVENTLKSSNQTLQPTPSRSDI